MGNEKTGISASSSELLQEVLGDVREMSSSCGTMASSLSTFLEANDAAFKGDGSAELRTLFENVKSFVEKMQTQFFDGSMTTMINEFITSTDTASEGITAIVNGG